MKTIPVLSIALALSLIGNAIALYHAGHASAARDATLDKARLQGAVKALEGRADLVNRVALAAEADGRLLQQQLQASTDALATSVATYRRTLATLPDLPAGCGPGQARVDAFNRATGATTP